MKRAHLYGISVDLKKILFKNRIDAHQKYLPIFGCLHSKLQLWKLLQRFDKTTIVDSLKEHLRVVTSMTRKYIAK